MKTSAVTTASALVLALALVAGGATAATAGPARAGGDTSQTYDRTILRVVRVIDGELVRVRHGNDKPFVVRQLGVSVPKSTCEFRAARRDLRDVLKPGQKIQSVAIGDAPETDRQKHKLRFLGLASGGTVVSVGLTQIAKGYANADRSISYPFKNRYEKYERAATAQGLGYHGSCG